MDTARRPVILKVLSKQGDKCYHAISRDTSCRPHEIVKLKIKDIVFKTTGSSQYAEALVNGKTGTRPIPIIDSIPYLKDYLDHEHPQPGNPNAPLICGPGKGLGRHIKPVRVNIIYREYKTQIFPKLLESPSVLPEDKQKIAEPPQKTLESVHQKAFGINRKVHNIEGTCFETACWLVWKFTDALEVFALFWERI